MEFRFKNVFSFKRVFEGETEPKTDPEPKQGKTFGEGDVNRIVQERLAKERKKFEKEKQGLLGRVEALGLTAAQKEELEEQMEQLRLESATKEEQTTAALKKMEKAHKKMVEGLTSERDSIMKLYTTEKIEREILSAAASGENPAVRPQQIVDILSPKTRVVKELGEDGKPTGRMVTRVRMSVKKEDGTTAELQLSPSEALSKMKENQESFGNLFKSGAVNGLGGSGSQGTGGDGKLDFSKISMDKFMEIFNKNPDALMK